MAPKATKSKANTATASARRSRRLAGGGAEETQSTTTGSGTTGLTESDPEKILRNARQAQRRKCERTPANTGEERASRKRSKQSKDEHRVEQDVERSSTGRSVTGQLHLPSAAPAGELERIEEISEGNTPAPGTTALLQTASTGPFDPALTTLQRREEGPTKEQPATAIERSAQVEAPNASSPTTNVRDPVPGLAIDVAPTQVRAGSEDQISPFTQPDNFANTRSIFNVDQLTQQQVDLKGAEHNGKTAAKVRAAEGRENSTDKRPNEDPAEGENEAEKQKAKHKEQQRSKKASRAPEPPSSNPCQDYRTSHYRLKRELFDFKVNLEAPAILGDYLYQETLFCAIAAVTEAIAEDGGPVVSLVDPIITGSRVAQRVARPGNTLYWPYVTGGPPDAAFRTRGGHLGLFIFESMSPEAGQAPNFKIQRYDSSARPDENRANVAYVEARNILIRNGWIDNSPEPISVKESFPRYPESRPAPEQRQGWVCGLHVIFTAWAHALGLRLSLDGRLGESFYQDGVEIVNLALRGHMDSDTIRNFLACYGFIDRRSVVPAACVFQTTHRFLNKRELSHHVARVRLDEELSELRRRNSSVPNLEAALDVLREFRGSFSEDDLVTWSGLDVSRQYQENLGLMTDPHFQPGTQPEGSTDEDNSSDPLQALEAALRAETAALQTKEGEESQQSRTSTTGIQEALRREILDSNIDIASLEPDIQQLLIDLPLDCIDEIRDLVQLLPRREDERFSDKDTNQGEVERSGNSGALPGLGYNLDNLPPFLQAFKGDTDGDALDTGRHSPDLPTPPHHPGNSNTPGRNDDDVHFRAEYHPPRGSSRIPSPFDYETPGVTDDADLTDYRTSDSDLEDVDDTVQGPLEARAEFRCDEPGDEGDEDERLERELFRGED